MKGRFLQDGFGNFRDHEILEFLLFYAMPRKDTNELGHLLLSRFGSLDRVFDAPIEELMRVEGVGEHTAVLLKTVPELSRRYRLSKLKKQSDMQSMQTVGDFLVEHYMPVSYEQVTMLLLDARQRMISFEVVHNGSANSSDLNIRRIVEIALAKGASSIILAHNHPNGELTPSDTDVATTKYLMKAFEPIDLHLREHVLVAGDRYLPIVRYIAENAEFRPRYIAVRADDPVELELE